MTSAIIVSRQQASLRLPRALTPIAMPVLTIFIHHLANQDTDNPLKDWSSTQGFHMNTKGWADIAYTLGVGIDKRNGANIPVVMEGRIIGSRPAVGAHTLGWNSKAIAIAVDGNFETDEATDLIMVGIRAAIDLAKQRNYCIANPTILSHSEVVRTACAGKNLRVRIPELANGVAAPELPSPSVPTQSKYPGFPLPSGHWFGVPNSNPKNHSGFWKEDRDDIMLFKSELERRGWQIKVTDRFDEATKKIVIAFQKEKGLKADGLVGSITHKAIWLAPIT